MNLTEYTCIFEEYKSRFIRFAISYIGDAPSAEDVVMEAFMSLWVKREKLTIDEAPAYVMTIIKNKLLNLLRNTKTHQSIEMTIAKQNQQIRNLRISSLESCNPQDLLNKELREMVGIALRKLPPKTRNIFLRSRYKEESYKEISSELDCTVKNIEYEVSKALKFLRQELKDYLSLILLAFAGINNFIF